MIENPPTTWRELQNRVAAILAECGFSSEVAKTIELARGKSEIDVYATDPAATPQTVYFGECKHWKTNVPQAEVQAFRTIVTDGGAHVGLFISSAGFQAGAYDVVKNTNVHLLSWGELQEMFIDRWCESWFIPRFQELGGSLATATEPLVSDAWMRESKGEALTPAEAVGMMANEMWGGPYGMLNPNRPGRKPLELPAAIFARRDHYARHLPPNIAGAQTLRDLLNELLAFCEAWRRDREAARQR